MATIKPAFKDYEYGWYGFNGAYNNHFMKSTATCYTYTHVVPRGFQTQNHYDGNFKSILKQIPKLKGVAFIYGDYKESI